MASPREINKKWTLEMPFKHLLSLEFHLCHLPRIHLHLFHSNENDQSDQNENVNEVFDIHHATKDQVVY